MDFIFLSVTQLSRGPVLIAPQSSQERQSVFVTLKKTILNSDSRNPVGFFDLTMFRNNNCGGFFDPRLVISERNIRQQNHWVCAINIQYYLLECYNDK